MKQYLKVIQDNLRRIRKSQNLSQQELGEKMGIKQAQYNRLESSEQEPNLNSLFRAAEALNIPLIELFRESNLDSLSTNELLQRVLDMEASEREPLLKVIEAYLKEYESKRMASPNSEEKMKILQATREATKGR